jgi:hypothetical protein
MAVHEAGPHLWHVSSVIYSINQGFPATRHIEPNNTCFGLTEYNVTVIYLEASCMSGTTGTGCIANRQPQIGGLKRNSSKRSGQSLDFERILQEAIVGAVSAIAYDAGIALVGGPPLTANQVLADIISGAVGGATGEIVLELTQNEILAVAVSALITGIVFQLVISEPDPPPGIRRQGLTA